MSPGPLFLSPYSEASFSHVFSLVLASSLPGEGRCSPILQLWRRDQRGEAPCPRPPSQEMVDPYAQLGLPVSGVDLQGPSRGQWLPEPGDPALGLFWLQGWKPHRRDQRWGCFSKLCSPSPSWAKTSRGDLRQVSGARFSGTSVRGEGQCFLEVSEPKDSPGPLLKADAQAWSWSFRRPRVGPWNLHLTSSPR